MKVEVKTEPVVTGVTINFETKEQLEDMLMALKWAQRGLENSRCWRFGYEPIPEWLDKARKLEEELSNAAAKFK